MWDRHDLTRLLAMHAALIVHHFLLMNLGLCVKNWHWVLSFNQLLDLSLLPGTTYLSPSAIAFLFFVCFGCVWLEN
jgi:hypothetical protein